MCISLEMAVCHCAILQKTSVILPYVFLVFIVWIRCPILCWQVVKYYSFFLDREGDISWCVKWPSIHIVLQVQIRGKSISGQKVFSVYNNLDVQKEILLTHKFVSIFSVLHSLANWINQHWSVCNNFRLTEL